MQEYGKALRLYKSLSLSQRKSLSKWMKKYKKNAPEFLNFFQHIAEYHTLTLKPHPQNPDWDLWIADKNVADLANKLSDMVREMEDFLLWEKTHKKDVVRTIELFYAYRDLGLSTYSVADLYNLKKQIPDYDLHTHYIHAQLMRELALLELIPKEKCPDDVYQWTLYTASESLFQECRCILQNKEYSNTYKYDFQHYREQYPQFETHPIIRVYKDLYHHLCTLSPSLEAIQESMTYAVSVESYFSHPRKRDIYILYTNLINRFFITPQTTQETYLKIWEILSLGYHAKWCFYGSTLTMRTFKNLVRIASRAYDSSAYLPRILKHITANKVNVNNGNKFEYELIMLEANWRIGDTSYLPLQAPKTISDSLMYKYLIFMMKISLHNHQLKELRRFALQFATKLTDIAEPQMVISETYMWYLFLPTILPHYEKPQNWISQISEMLVNIQKTPIMIEDKAWYIQQLSTLKFQVTTP